LKLVFPHGDAEGRSQTGVLVCVVSALYTRLWLGVAVQASLYKLNLALDLVELGICLEVVSLMQ
jgi:hypothetical protein